jgi:hypothetical protein
MAKLWKKGRGKLGLWSFTSDGKRSTGLVADVTDLHEEAVGFEAQMPAGLARMAYWPEEGGGSSWVVESKNAKGWKRFVHHHYRPASPYSGSLSHRARTEENGDWLPALVDAPEPDKRAAGRVPVPFFRAQCGCEPL